MVSMDILRKLDQEDQEKILYFAGLLLKQEKYKKLREEIEIRKMEIEKGDVLTHDEVWNRLDV